MLMILARLVRSESFWAVVKVRSPHNRPEVWYPRRGHVCHINRVAGRGVNIIWLIVKIPVVQEGRGL